MNDVPEWGPWVDHDGKRCPLPVGTVVEGIFERLPGQYVRAVGSVGPHDIGYSWDWSWWMRRAPDDLRFVARIRRYLVRRPQALRDLIRMAADPYSPPARQPEEVA